MADVCCVAGLHLHACQETLAGVGWHKVVLSVPSVPPSGIAKGPLLEFVFTDGQGAWDKPAEGDGNFIADSKGTYSVVGGVVSAVAGKPVMLVTDLDDTLVRGATMAV